MSLRKAAKSFWMRSLMSVFAGLILAGIVIQVSGYPVVQAYSALWTGATGLQAGPAVGPNDIALGAMHLNKYLLAQSLARVTPLLLTGLAVAVGLKAGLFNIGAQGQMVVGGLTAAFVGGAPLPPVLAVTLALGCGALGGAVWGAVAGLLKAARGVHEVISTILLNYIAVDIADYLVTHNLKDASGGIEQTREIAVGARLPEWVLSSGLTLGLPLALVAAVLVTLLLRRTVLGYRIRAVGAGAEAARAAGIDVSRTLIVTMAISGALAGLAGGLEILSLSHRYLKDGLGDYGFDGIAVALLGGLEGAGVALSALFFGLLAKGAAYMKLQANVPEDIAVIVEAIVILFVGIRTFGWKGRRPLSLASAAIPVAVGVGEGPATENDPAGNETGGENRAPL